MHGKWCYCLLLFDGKISKSKSKLFEEAKGEDGVRSKSNVSRNETFEKRGWTLLGSDSNQMESWPELSWTRVHGTRLQKVQGLGQSRGNQGLQINN